MCTQTYMYIDPSDNGRYVCLPQHEDFVLESFAVTQNATSVDGQHYYQEVNILLAQLLLMLSENTTGGME